MNLIKTVAVVGAGSWGTALARNIAESKPHVSIRIWAFEKSVTASINTINENTEYLKGVRLPPGIRATSVLREAVEGADAVLIATPSKVLFDISQKTGRFVTGGMHIGFLTKGFCTFQDEVLTISQTIERAMPHVAGRVVAISGPSHAEEVSERFHTCLNVASRSAESRRAIADLLNSEYIQCRDTEDILAVEVGGTLKNPAAIAAGMISVMPRCGDNLAGALISEALKEMIRLGKIFDISEEGMIDISGLGDLVATALSRHSRNRRFGRDISNQIMKKGKTLTLIDRIALRIRPVSVIERMSSKLHYLAEGAYAIEPLIRLAESRNISIPVYRALYEVLLNKKDLSLLVETIKNPARFDELFFSTKIQLSERKKGLEEMRGQVFHDIIADRTRDHFSAARAEGSGAADGETLMRQLREWNESRKRFGPGRIDPREEKIIDRITRENLADSVRQLSRMHLADITDKYNTLFKWLFSFYLVLVASYNLIRRKRGRAVVSGKIEEVRRIGGSVNVIYVSTFASRHEALHVIGAILRKRLPYPRFFIGADAVGVRDMFFLRRCGGFVVDRDRLANPVYRETVRQYISVLAGHGVPLLYFPHREQRDGADPDLNEFYSAVTESLYKHTVEMALIPVEVSHFRRPDEQGGSRIPVAAVLSRIVHVNFSDPIYLSEYTRQPHLMIGLDGIVRSVWGRDLKIFPHNILCRLLVDHKYNVKYDSSAKMVREYLSRSGRRIDYHPAKIVRRGMQFLVRNGIASVRDGWIIADRRDEVEYYAKALD